MKEFSAQTGGRYTYVDDIINLQELALAFASIFNGCDNFIISGCTVNGSTISAGYVYLNGKIRYFSGATGISRWPQYIYEVNSSETVAYASGSDKVGRNIYGCAIGSSVPSSLDPLTNAIPQYISMPSSGGLQMKDALFGRYALLLNARSGSQTVNGTVSFSGIVNLSNALNALGGVNVAGGSTTGRMYNNNGQLVIESQIGSNGTVRKIVVDDENNIAFFVGGNRVARITSSGIISEQTIQGVNLYGGNVYVSSNHIYNRGTYGDGALYINYNGYNGGTSYYRTTIIGNGKQGAVVEVNGTSSSVAIFGPLTLNTAVSNGLILKTNLPKTNVGLLKLITWQDSNADQIAYIGYNYSLNNIFEIKNNLANVSIKGASAVDLGPAIMENGVLLSDKYAAITSMNTALGSKANSADVYTKTQTGEIFATKEGGFDQYLANFTKAQLRAQIGAITTDDVTNSYAKLDRKLADMAITEADKTQICNNIGAARPGDFQAALRDSGWIAISGTSLYARQIGNIVCIQGTITTIHSGTVFTLPNQIDAPHYAVAYKAPMDCNHNWGCKIDGGSRQCKVVYCDHHGKTIQLSMSYMV